METWKDITDPTKLKIGDQLRSKDGEHRFTIQCIKSEHGVLYVYGDGQTAITFSRWQVLSTEAEPETSAKIKVGQTWESVDGSNTGRPVIDGREAIQ